MFVHQVSELQTSLSECREELVFYLQQMEEVTKNYESELQKNKDKVQREHTNISVFCPLLFFMQP